MLLSCALFEICRENSPLDKFLRIDFSEMSIVFFAMLLVSIWLSVKVWYNKSTLILFMIGCLIGWLWGFVYTATYYGQVFGIYFFIAKHIYDLDKKENGSG